MKKQQLRYTIQLHITPLLVKLLLNYDGLCHVKLIFHLQFMTVNRQPVLATMK